MYVCVRAAICVWSLHCVVLSEMRVAFEMKTSHTSTLTALLSWRAASSAPPARPASIVSLRPEAAAASLVKGSEGTACWMAHMQRGQFHPLRLIASIFIQTNRLF